ncbi:MAG: hypothetical protein ACOC6K_03280 [Thermodesulfobacteriota bacterium]
MARKKPSGKIVWLLLILCLLWGMGGSAVGAEEVPGVQLVVVLDSSHLTGDSQMNCLVPQAASLLVHLLGDQNYLGLVGSGEPDETLLPTAGLSPEHRQQALDTLARFAPARQQKPLAGALQQALAAFEPQGPKRRVLFWLGGEGGVVDAKPTEEKPPQLEQIAEQARREGVIIFAALMAPGAAWHTLASDTSGHCWEIKAASNLHVPCLKLYQYLAQPQEVLVADSQVRLDRWVDGAVMVLTRSDPEKGVVLTDPRKARITEGTRARNVRWVAGRSCDLITLTRPRPGVWSFSGAQSEVGRVFLSTDLILEVAEPPREVAADEALPVTANLHADKGSRAASGLLAGTDFSAELQINDTQLIEALKKPPIAQNPDSTGDVRTGRFPPVHQEGDGTLKVVAQGKNFQRLRSLAISITSPWYRVTPQAQETPVELPLHFQPHPGRRAEQAKGTLTLKSALGSLSGIMITPDPGAEIILDRSPGSEDISWADLHLQATTAAGRHLDIISGPLRLQNPPSAVNNTTQPPAEPDSPGEVQEKNQFHFHLKPWMWLALSGLGGGVLLASAFLMWRLRRDAEGLDGEEDFGGHLPTSVLRLKAQVEALVKEKAALEAALKEKTEQWQKVQEEKVELQADLDRYQKKSQEYFKNMQDLEQKVIETDEEAKRVREEYMALYARNQREQRALKKG